MSCYIIVSSNSNSFTGCQNRKGTASMLKEAEALMYTRPDSALQMLETISQQI